MVGLAAKHLPDINRHRTTTQGRYSNFTLLRAPLSSPAQFFHFKKPGKPISLPKHQ
jgi:hypothetical protein